jgi:hypothetical protein
LSSRSAVAAASASSSRPQQVTDIGGQAVHLALLAVQRERVAATLGHPEVAAEALAQGGCLALEALG